MILAHHTTIPPFGFLAIICLAFLVVLMMAWGWDRLDEEEYLHPEERGLEFFKWTLVTHIVVPLVAIVGLSLVDQVRDAPGFHVWSVAPIFLSAVISFVVLNYHEMEDKQHWEQELSQARQQEAIRFDQITSGQMFRLTQPYAG